MAIKAVDEKPSLSLLDARLVVGKGGAHAGAHFDNLRFAKGGVERIGCIHEFDRGAHADRALLPALDHGRAEHEYGVRARDDIEGHTRMQKANWTGEPHLARAHADHLAADPAQVIEFVPGREAPAIDDDAVIGLELRAVLAEADFRAARAQGLEQRAHRRARVEMAFVGEEQALAETPGKIRLELSDLSPVHARVRLRARREPVNLTHIARSEER